MSRRILFLTASPRNGSNSRRLAAHAAEALPDTAKAHWLDLNTPALPAFRDLRPDHPGVPMGRLGDVFGQIMLATDLVFVAPIYWYAFPAPLHLTLSHLSGWLDVPELRLPDGLSGKRCYLITARADPDPSAPAPAETLLRLSVEWLGMTWAGALHGVADAPGEIEGTAAWNEAPRFLLAPGIPTNPS